MHLDNEHVATRYQSLSPSPIEAMLPLREQLDTNINYATVPVPVPGPDIDIIEITDDNEMDRDDHVINATELDKSNTGLIRVRSLENLYENYKHHTTNDHHEHAVNHSQYEYSNESSVENVRESTTAWRHDNVNVNAECDVDNNDHDEQFNATTMDHLDDTDTHTLPSALKFNRKTMTIYVKKSSEANSSQHSENHLRDSDSSSNLVRDNSAYENVVCLPNFEPISFDHFDNDHEDGGYIDMDGENDSSNGNEASNQSSANDGKFIICDDGDMMVENTEYHCQPTTSQMHHISALGARMNPRIGAVPNMLRLPSRAINANRDLPLPSTVTLRNPRSNQPRSYNKEALYSALMDVKSGESIYKYISMSIDYPFPFTYSIIVRIFAIYRASQMHGVPRKTLRNWMKRWDIKSAYPMPYQLKRAAEKKKKERRT